MSTLKNVKNARRWAPRLSRGIAIAALSAAVGFSWAGVANAKNPHDANAKNPHDATAKNPHDATEKNPHDATTSSGTSTTPTTTSISTISGANLTGANLLSDFTDISVGSGLSGTSTVNGNVLLGGNLTGQATINGSVAVLGNVAGGSTVTGNADISGNLVGNSTIGGCALVGGHTAGDVTVSGTLYSASAPRGNATVGSYSGSSSCPVGTVDVTGLTSSGISSMLGSVSSSLSGYAPTGSLNDGVISATPGSGGGTAVVNLTASQLNSLPNLGIATDGASSLIINVTGSGPVSIPGTSVTGGLTGSDILWNVSGPSSVTVSGSTDGTILAPNASSQVNGSLNGTIVGSSVSGSGSVTQAAYKGYLPAVANETASQIAAPNAATASAGSPLNAVIVMTDVPAPACRVLSGHDIPLPVSVNGGSYVDGGLSASAAATACTGSSNTLRWLKLAGQ